MFPAVTSAFKEKYPLAPKKFWKKMLSSVFGNFTVSGMFAMFCGIIGIMLPTIIDRHAEPSPINFVIFFLLGGLIMAAILFGWSAWYFKAYIRTYFYDAGQGYLTIRKGVFTPSEIHVMYQKIQDVYVDQDLFDRIMGLFDVHIASATATSGIEAHIDGVDAATADALKNFRLSRFHSGTIGGVTAPRPLSGEPSQSSALAANQKIELSSTNVSSETFPISPKWIISNIIGSIFSTVVLVIFFGFQFLPNLSASAAGFIMLVIIIILFVTIFGLQVGGALLWKANFSWVFTPNFLEVRTGIISKRETHLPYSSIQDVLIKQSLVERLFGLCTVTIQNAAGMSSGYSRKGSPNGTNLPGQPLAKGNELVEIVRKMSQVGQAGRI